MKIHLLSGFLGSGKTTAIAQAILSLQQQGIIPGVISNDQGTTLVDGSYFSSMHIPGREVSGGCFCCNYNVLVQHIASLMADDKTGIIFAESVGSCTDIFATVVKPLEQFRPDVCVTLSVFADARLLQMMLAGTSSFDVEVRYIYLKQLEEARILVVNKVDLISPLELEQLKDMLPQKHRHCTILYQDSRNQQDIRTWLRVLDEQRSAPAFPSLEIDYNAYAAGEAKMGWLDEVVEIWNDKNKAWQVAGRLVNQLHQNVQDAGYPIGHLKFLVNDSVKISFASVNETPVSMQHGDAAKVSLLINARVQAPPASLQQLVEAAINETALATGSSISIKSHNAFQPGYPRPTHRMI